MAVALAQAVGKRVRAIRTRQGLTIEQLATMSGLPPESISRVERGRTSASLRTLDQLARGLGVKLPDLVGDDPVNSTAMETMPLEVRGVAMLLAGKTTAVIDKARRIVEILVEEG